jgi:hypothetical protein
MTTPDIVKAIANELDGSERYVLTWIAKQVTVPYREISGESFDRMLVRGLVRLNPSAKPRACWPVIITELGMEVISYILTHKTIATGKLK